MNKTAQTGLYQFKVFFILQSIVMKIITLPLQELWELHGEKVIFSSSYTESDFNKEWQSVRDCLRIQLQSKWKESCYGDADFALSDDRSNTWAQAGGIQNLKLLSSNLLDMTFDTLKRNPHNEKWGVLFRIDCCVKTRKKEEITGEILLKNNQLYVAEYKNYKHGLISKLFGD